MKKTSIIIPTLNEEKALPSTLSALKKQATSDHEIIIVDGGSQDKTCAIAKKYDNIKLLNSKQGRSSQMNSGARIASAQWLLFLHADTILPEKALSEIDQLTANKKVLAGCFQQEFSNSGALLRLISRLHNWRCNKTNIMYGDQAIFVRRSTFQQINGFPDQAILEDIALSEKLLTLGKPIMLENTVITDSRKFIDRGIIRSFLEIAIILTCYELKLPIMAKGFFSEVR